MVINYYNMNKNYIHSKNNIYFISNPMLNVFNYFIF